MSLLVVGSVALDSVETPTRNARQRAGRLGRLLSRTRPATSRRCGWWASSAKIGRPSTPSCCRSRASTPSGLHVVPGGKTFRWRGKYHAEHERPRDARSPSERVREVRSGAAGRVSQVQVPVPGQRLADHADEGARPGARRRAGRGRHDGPVDQHAARRAAGSCCRRIDGLVLNDSEAKLLTGDENLVRAGHKVREMGPKFVVIKKGEHGAMFFSEHETYVHARLSHARRRRPDRRGRQLCRRHDGLPGRARQLRPARRSRKPWPTASSWPASTSKISASTG